MRVFRQRYKGRDGKTKKSAKWYVEFKDHNETMRRLPAFTEKAATQELGRRLEKLIASRVLGQTPGPDLARWLETIPAELRKRLAKIGLLDSRIVANSKRLSEHLSDFHASILHKNRTRNHANLTEARVRNVLDGCRFVYFSDISAASVERFLAEQRDNGNGMGAQTSNYYLQAFKQFCKWLVRDGRASESPVEHLSGVNAKLDRRHDRRNLTADELVRLLIVTMKGATHHKLGGRSRAMLYRLAMESGLRRKELAALTPSSFDFKAGEPTVSVSPRNVKNRKATTLPIRQVLADELQRWFEEAEIGPESPLWRKLTKRTSDMLKRDLEAAGIPYVDDSGLFADFHALRHSFVSLITQGGVHPKIAQRLARHSTVELTLARYSHTLLSDEADALEVLPKLPSVFDGDASQQQMLRATGTDAADKRPENVLPLCLPAQPAFEGNSVHSPAVSHGPEVDESGTVQREEKDEKPVQKTGFEEGKRRERDSNPRSKEIPTHRISNPALSATQPSLRYATASYTVSCRAGHGLELQLLLPASRNPLQIFVNRCRQSLARMQQGKW